MSPTHGFSIDYFTGVIKDSLAYCSVPTILSNKQNIVTMMFRGYQLLYDLRKVISEAFTDIGSTRRISFSIAVGDDGFGLFLNGTDVSPAVEQYVQTILPQEWYVKRVFTEDYEGDLARTFPDAKFLLRRTHNGATKAFFRHPTIKDILHPIGSVWADFKFITEDGRCKYMNIATDLESHHNRLYATSEFLLALYNFTPPEAQNRREIPVVVLEEF